MLTTTDLAIGYPSRRLAQHLNLSLRPAELVCLIGPNGAGKSTLLRTLAGMQSPLAGQVRLNGADLHRLPALELARQLAVVLTGRVEAGNLSAYALVTLGRHPYTDWRGRLTAHDEAVAQQAMHLTGSAGLAQRKLNELSDGERQKVMIARALAQEPRLLLLDEPTAFLDLPRRVDLLQLLRRLARTTGCATLLTTHDLDLALRIADKLWLLSSSGELHVGLPEELALNGALAQTFASEGVEFDHAIGAFKVHQPTQGQISLAGRAHGIAAAWTWRALARIGYEVIEAGAPLARHVEIVAAGGQPAWRVSTPQGVSEHAALASLVEALSR